MMNHGLINKSYYKNNLILSDGFDIYEVYVELNQLKNYFARLKKRDRYYAAMKYHAIKRAYEIYPTIILEQLAHLINAADHSTVLYYLNEYIPVEGHGEFIKNNFINYINNFIYPLTPKTTVDIKEYGLYKPTHIPLQEIKDVEDQKKKRSYIYQVAKSKKERY